MQLLEKQPLWIARGGAFSLYRIPGLVVSARGLFSPLRGRLA